MTMSTAKFRTLLTLILTFPLITVYGQQPATMKDLREMILQKFRGHEGTFACAFRVAGDSSGLFINADTVFHAASTMKVPVMIEVFNQAERGVFNLNDSILLKNEFRSIVDGSVFQLSESDDGDTDLYQRVGSRMSIYDLTWRMITRSSNFATNLLIQLVGAGNVMNTLRLAGADKTLVLRGVEDQKAFDAGLNNVTTARDLLTLFMRIAEMKMVSPRASGEMVKILEGQEFNSIIPALLPSGVKIAHKTGNITGVEHDGGIIYLPDGRKYILVLLSKNLTDRDGAVKMMSEVSRMVYDFVRNG